MGRTRLLTVFAASIGAGDFEVFSWGPFRGALRFHRIWLRNGDSTATRTSAGLFVANDPSRYSGAYVAPFTGFAGWTPLHDPSDVDTPNNDDLTGRFAPFQQTSADGLAIVDAGRLDVRGALFYVKLWVRNSSGGGVPVNAHLVVEENPADVDPEAIDVRPIPGTEPPAPPPPPTTPPPAPPPPAPPPPPEPPPTTTLPLPSIDTIPPITLDPQDVDASIREFIQV